MWKLFLFLLFTQCAMNNQQQHQNQQDDRELILYLKTDVSVIENKLHCKDPKVSEAIQTLLSTHNAQIKLLEGTHGKPSSQDILIIHATQLDLLKESLLEYTTLFDTGYIKDLGEDPGM